MAAKPILPAASEEIGTLRAQYHVGKKDKLLPFHQLSSLEHHLRSSFSHADKVICYLSMYVYIYIYIYIYVYICHLSHQ